MDFFIHELTLSLRGRRDAFCWRATSLEMGLEKDCCAAAKGDETLLGESNQEFLTPTYHFILIRTSPCQSAGV